MGERQRGGWVAAGHGREGTIDEPGRSAYEASLLRLGSPPWGPPYRTTASPWSGAGEVALQLLVQGLEVDLVRSHEPRPLVIPVAAIFHPSLLACRASRAKGVARSGSVRCRIGDRRASPSMPDPKEAAGENLGRRRVGGGGERGGLGRTSSSAVLQRERSGKRRRVAAGKRWARVRDSFGGEKIS